MFARERDDGVESLAVEHVAGRIVGRRDDDSARGRSPQPLQIVGVGRAVIRKIGVPPRDLRSSRLGHRIVRLIRGELADDVVAGFERDAHEGEDRLLGAAVYEHLVGRRFSIERRDGIAQIGRAAGGGVSEAQIGQRLTRAWVEGEQLRNRERLGVARTKKVARRELMAIEVALEQKRLRLHEARFCKCAVSP